MPDLEFCTVFLRIIGINEIHRRTRMSGAGNAVLVTILVKGV
jgi:hypothetical protein